MANEKVKFVKLAAINASGTSEKSLYSALSTDMFLGQPSKLEIRVEKGVVAPYFTVPLLPIETLNHETKKVVLAEECIKQTASNLTELSANIQLSSIEKVVIVTSTFNDNEQDNFTQWQESIQAMVNDYLPDFKDKLEFNYYAVDSLNTRNNIFASYYSQPSIVICVDVLTGYNDIKVLSTMLEIQCQGGNLGVMPSEGATSLLILPMDFPVTDITSLVQVENATLKQKLISAEFSLPAHVIHVGTHSQRWVKHWYGQTNTFNHTSVQHIEVDNNTIEHTKTLGFLGAANLSTALISAKAYVHSPLNNIESIWVVEHNMNDKGQLPINGSQASEPNINVFKVSLLVA